MSREEVGVRTDDGAGPDPAVVSPAPVRFLETRPGRVLLGVVPFVVALLVWAALPWWRPEFLRLALPPLDEVINALYNDIFVTQNGITGTRFTLTAWFGGLAVAAVPAVLLGIGLGLVRAMHTLFYPLIVAVQAIPLIALAPLIILVFGFGVSSKVVMASIVAFFPIMVGVMQGVRSVRSDEIDLLRTLNATRWQIFMQVRLPRAVPSTFGGLQVASVFALIGAVVGEFIGATDGLGYLIALRSARLQVPGIYSAIILISVLAVLLNLLLSFLDRRLTSWEET